MWGGQHSVTEHCSNDTRKRAFYKELYKVLFPRFCVEGLPKMSDFGYFVLIWWHIDKTQETLKQSCKDLLQDLFFTSLPPNQYKISNI